jgi:ABC-type lipoprotein export system ATPase subunit
MNQVCFDLKNASFAYHGKEIVLHVDSLQILKGKVYFILGRSGVGKSTLLEALGLMNDTVHKNTETITLYTNDHKAVDISKIFYQKSEVTKIRSEEYSFIFQDTNLMPSLTAGENMMLSSLVSNTSYDVIKSKIEKLLKKFELPDVFDKRVQYLSGGQRQRLAFIRAFVSEYNVLFGDEPTGNLDPVTARTIMKNLKEEIQTENKSCIIVSHDIQLAIEIADTIIYITQHKDESKKIEYGHITSENVIHKVNDEWIMEGKKIENSALQNFIFDQLKNIKMDGKKE